MRPRITHIGCAACGGTLGVQEGQRLVACHYCDGQSLVYKPDHVPRFVLPPRQTSRQARDAVAQAMRQRQIPPEAQRSAAAQLPQLYYVPYYELNAKLLGRTLLTTRSHKRRSGRARTGPDGRLIYTDAEGRPISFTQYYHHREVAEFDTKIIMNELYQAGPATRLDGWGLDQVDLRALRTGQEELHLRPYDAVETQGEALVFSPDLTEEQFLKQAERSSTHTATRVEVEIAERQLQIIYYPVWRLRYVHAGQVHYLTVDGFSGDVLAGTAPQTHTGGALAMILAGVLVALPLAKLLRHVGDLGPAFAALLGSGIGLVLAPLALLLLLGPLAVAWAEFRYTGEVVFSRGSSRVRKINMPPRTALDRVIDVLVSWLQEGVKQAQQQQRGYSRW